MSDIPEYDLHPSGMRADDAVAEFDRIISSCRGRGVRLFAVITGYGSSGGTSMIKSSILASCRRYKRLNHIRGFIDGEKAGDMFSPEFLAFPEMASVPVCYKRSANPGMIFVAL